MTEIELNNLIVAVTTVQLLAFGLRLMFDFFVNKL